MMHLVDVDIPHAAAAAAAAADADVVAGVSIFRRDVFCSLLIIERGPRVKIMVMRWRGWTWVMKRRTLIFSSRRRCCYCCNDAKMRCEEEAHEEEGV